MGVEEEAGKAVGGFMSALTDQPLSLALVVMNIALLILVYINASEQNTYRRQVAELLIKQFRETDILLSKCVDADEVRKLKSVLSTASSREARASYSSPGLLTPSRSSIDVVVCGGAPERGHTSNINPGCVRHRSLDRAAQHP